VRREAGEPFLKIHKRGDKKFWFDGWSLDKGRIAGTYVHGVLDSPGFRGEFLNSIRKAKGLKLKPPRQGRGFRDKQYDLLADHFEKHCDVEKIIRIVSEERRIQAV
jgi:cobyric acid synthase